MEMLVAGEVARVLDTMKEEGNMNMDIDDKKGRAEDSDDERNRAKHVIVGGFMEELERRTS